jgi:restriction endonuclease S subunit
MKWEMVKINSICEIVRGSSPRPQGDPRYYGGPIPRLMIEDITRDGKYVTPKVDSLTEAGALLSRPMKKGDIVLTVSGRTGVPSILAVDACIHDGFVGFRNLIKDVDVNYLYWYLNNLTNVTNSKSVGAIFKNLTTEQIKEITIPLPPITTQRRIAEILDKADALRQKDQALLRKYDELAQAVFVDMFGDPVRNEKGWEVENIGKNITSIRYGTGSPPKYSDFGIPFIRATNIKKGRIVKKGMVYLSIDEAKTIEKCFIKEGDLIVVRSGVNTGDCGYISKEYDGCLAGYDLIIEMDRSKARFYHFLINSHWGKNIIEKLSRRAAQPHLNSDQVKSIEFIAPPIDLIKRFGLIIDSINTSYDLIEGNVINNDSLFQSLLQKAFTGELVE